MSKATYGSAEFNLGNTGRSIYKIQVSELKLKFEEYDCKGNLVMNLSKEISPEEWTAFLGQIKKNHMEKWNEEYHNDSIDEENTFFDVSIKTGSININSFGFNAFPPNGTIRMSKNFRFFLDMLKRLSEINKLDI